MSKSIIDKIGEFSKFGSKLGLERMYKLLAALGNPQADLQVIHIAGTNGKGSVSRFVTGVLLEAGYNVGMFTSPYIEHFHERIELAGMPISHYDLDFYGQKVIDAAKRLIAEGEESPTEFELITAIAFLYFKDKNAHPIVLEVGLGGKGDSTNVIDRPLVTAITSIGMDHMDRLGDTIEEIAREKAGIIKASTPLVTIVSDEIAIKTIKEYAKKVDAPVFDNISFEISETGIFGSKFNAEIFGHSWNDIEISMIGEHQASNASIALGIIDILRDFTFDISEGHIRLGLKKMVNPARFEILRRKPLIILDGAHNADGTEAFAATVETLERRGDITGNRDNLLVVGMLADKEITTMVRNLSKIEKMGFKIIATEPKYFRKLDKEKLADAFAKEGVKVYKSLSGKELIDEIIKCKGTVLVVGSLYLMGDIRGDLRAYTK